MSVKEIKDHGDPRYASYPPKFRPYWPDHFVHGGIIAIVISVVGILLAYFYQFPSDLNMPPLPDSGDWIPGPEWYQMVFFQPFWYIADNKSFLMQFFTFWAPLILLVLVFLVPFIMRKKKSREESGSSERPKAKMFIPAVSVAIIMALGIFGVVGSGYPSKIYGCSSCHNPMMGVRQALPPADMAGFYRVQRKRQIEVGKYRAGKTEGAEMTLSIGAAQSYKDANWQLRHMYEPTLTW